MSSLENETCHYYVAGAFAGMGGMFIGHPLDTTKVQLQTCQHHGVMYKSSMDAILNIAQQDTMMRGFFRGLSFPLITSILVNSVYYGTYGGILNLLQSECNVSTGCDPVYMHAFFAGCAGGLAQSFFVGPAELVKVILQSQVRHNGVKSVSTTRSCLTLLHTKHKQHCFNGPREATVSIYRRFGLMGFFRGFPLLIGRDVPCYGIHALVYEWLFRRLSSMSIFEGSDALTSLLAGGVTGTVSWSCAMPLDVTKSLMQADVERIRYRNAIDCAAQLYESRGFRGFFTGLTVTCCRAFPVCAVTFLIYSQTLKYLL